MAIVAAMGLGLALTTSLEPLAAANYEANRSARLAAEAGVAIAVHELAGIDDWDLALGGLVTSAVLDHGDTVVDLPDGSRAGLRELTDRANCGRAGACPDSERTAARPWGPNNPQQGLARPADRLFRGGLPPTVVVAWISTTRQMSTATAERSGIARRRMAARAGAGGAMRRSARCARTVVAMVAARPPAPAPGSCP
jgi:hypothetical protein